ncbi:F-box protein, partial [Diplonema papillatum]
MNTAAFPAKKSIAKYSPMNRKKKFALVCIGIGALMFIGLPTCFHQPPPISVSVDDDRTAKAAAKTFHEDVYAWIMGSEDLAPIIKAKKFAHMVPVDRVDEKDLPFKKYYEEYVLKEKPVVVTNLKSYTNGIWSIEYLKKMCGDNEVTPLVPTTAGSVWANLVPQNDTTFSDFLDNFKTLPQPRPYLHDFSLIRRCPKIMNEFIVPRYYVQDYLVQAYEH